ncbi:MAG: hypothetical protein ACI9MR_001715 [Myxococcota bacterium]|jgi:hypothetical protein
MTYVLTIALVGLLMAAMAVGVIFSNRALKGSCGGKGGPECACDAQGIPRKCEPSNPGDDRGDVPRNVVPTSAFGRRKP